MSFFLQTLVLRGILSSQQERAVESFSDVEEFQMKKILTQYGVCALVISISAPCFVMSLPNSFTGACRSFPKVP